MTEKKQIRSHATALPTGIRWCSGILGLLLIGLAAMLIAWCFPTAYEWKGDGTMVKSTRAVSDLSGVVTALVLAGVGLFVFALNGVRLVKFGAGSLVAEGSQAVEYAKRRMEHPPSDEDARKVDLPDDEDVEPTEAPAAVLDGDMAVFELNDVPTKVIRDALVQWPDTAGSPPDSLAEFQFASRKRGRGSHPWILKFEARPEVRVFYGGRGKSGATVRPVEG